MYRSSSLQPVKLHVQRSLPSFSNSNYLCRNTSPSSVSLQLPYQRAPSTAMVFAVCCTVDMSGEVRDKIATFSNSGLIALYSNSNHISTQLLNTFLTKTYNAPNSRPYDFMLIVVRSREQKYTDPENLPVHEDVVASPFKGKNASECHDILHDIRRETGSEFDYEYFVVMDEQSAKDVTVLLVGADDEEVSTMRVEFEIAKATLLARFAGVGSWPDDLIVHSPTCDN